jgi:CheY-like chemotaxis protein
LRGFKPAISLPVLHARSARGEVKIMPKPQILIVEDEVITAMELRSRLENAGYTVSAIVSSAEDAIAGLSSYRPDLVLMDIRLRGDMDGIQAAEAIRRRYDIAVVYLTAYADEETSQRAEATHPYGYIYKPFEEQDIYTTVERALYKHEMEGKVVSSQ